MLWQVLSSRSKGKPRFELSELGKVRCCCRNGRTLLNSLQPGCHLLRGKHVSLPTNRQGTFEDFEQFLESKRVSVTMSEPAGDIDLALQFNLGRVGTGQASHEGQQLLALLVSGRIIQIYGEAADWTREASWHLLDEHN